jgi:hypothetical protein
LLRLIISSITNYRKDLQVKNNSKNRTLKGVLFLYEKKKGDLMYIPSITNIETALTIYYKHAEVGNKEIRELFGCRSSATVSRLKRLARAEMITRGVPTFNAYKINTAVAYDAWGIDIDSLEERMRKIKELAL